MVDILSGIGTGLKSVGTGVTEFTRGLAAAQPGAMDRRSRENLQEASFKRREAQTLRLQEQDTLREIHALRAELDRANTATRQSNKLKIDGLNSKAETYLEKYQMAFDTGDREKAKFFYSERMRVLGEAADLSQADVGSELAVEKVMDSTAPPTEAPEAGGIPGLPELPTGMPGLKVEGVPPPAVEAKDRPSDPIADYLDLRASQLHSKALVDLMPQAFKYGATNAFTAYVAGLPHSTVEQRETARKAFVEAEKRNPEIPKAQTAMEKEALRLVITDKMPAVYVFAQFKEQWERRWGSLPTRSGRRLAATLMAADAKVEFLGEEKSRMGRIKGLQLHIQETLDYLTGDELKGMLDEIGGVGGMATSLKLFMANYTEGTQWEWDDKEVMPLRRLVNLLSGSTDMMARLMTGAALTLDEQRFYSNLIGSIGTSPKALRQNLTDMIGELDNMEMGMYKANYEMRAGKPVTARQILGEIKFGDGPIDPLSVLENPWAASKNDPSPGSKKKIDEPTADKGLPHFDVGMLESDKAKDLEARGLLNKWVMIEQDIQRDTAIGTLESDDSELMMYPEALGKALKKHDWPEDEPIPIHGDKDLATSHRFMLDYYNSKYFSKRTGWTGGYDERGRKRQ
jgi:hypothetical protein